MDLILGILTGAALLACALVAVWMAGAILLRRVRRSRVGPLGRAGLGRWRRRDVRGLAAALAADRRLARGGVAIPRLVVPAEAEQRPRLGPEHGRVAARRDRRRCGDDRKRPQPRIPFDRRFHAAVRNPHLSSLESQRSGRHLLRLGRRVQGPPRPGLRLRTRRPHLHVDRGANHQGAGVLGLSQPVSAAGADLRRRGRTRRDPAAHEVQRTSMGVPLPHQFERRGAEEAVPRLRRYDQPTVRDARAGTTCCSPTARRRSTSSPARRSAGTGASSPTPDWIGPSTRTVAWTGHFRSRNSADSPTSTTSRTQPRRRGSGTTSAANSKGAAMNDEVIPLLKVHEYFQGASDETLAGSRAARPGRAVPGRQRRPRGGRRAHHGRLRPPRAAQGRSGRAPTAPSRCSA